MVKWSTKDIHSGQGWSFWSTADTDSASAVAEEEVWRRSGWKGSGMGLKKRKGEGVVTVTVTVGFRVMRGTVRFQFRTVRALKVTLRVFSFELCASFFKMLLVIATLREGLQGRLKQFKSPIQI